MFNLFEPMVDAFFRDTAYEMIGDVNVTALVESTFDEIVASPDFELAVSAASLPLQGGIIWPQKVCSGSGQGTLVQLGSERGVDACAELDSLDGMDVFAFGYQSATVSLVAKLPCDYSLSVNIFLLTSFVFFPSLDGYMRGVEY